MAPQVDNWAILNQTGRPLAIELDPPPSLLNWFVMHMGQTTVKTKPIN